MTRMSAKVGRRIAPLLLALLMQVTGLALPGQAQAQTNKYGPPFGVYVFGPNAGTKSFPTLSQAITAADAGYLAINPTVGCTPGYTLSTDTTDFLGGYAADVGYSYACGTLWGENTSVVMASFYYDVGLNLGACDTCGGNGHKGAVPVKPGSPVMFDPINTATGNKFEQDNDYVAPSSWLTFQRFYNNQGGMQSTTLGTVWRHSFDRSLVLYTGGSPLINLFRPDGRFELFQKVSGVWSAAADVTDKLIEQDDASGHPIGYTVVVAGALQTEQYSTSGLLQSITDNASGQITTLTYSTATTPTSVAPAPNLLLTVTDPNGRTLSFTYTSAGNLYQVTQPDGGLLTYGYDTTTGNLVSVTYPDTHTGQYLYNESSMTGGASLPSALTGVIDETGVRYQSTMYAPQASFDTIGRATYTSLAGGAEAATINYGSFSSYTGVAPATVTTPLGTAINLGYQNVLGTIKVTSSSTACGPECNQPWKTRTYDPNGYPKLSTDFNNVVMATTYDANGLLDQQIEAQGTPTQRTTTTTWNTTLRMPLTETVQDNNGNIVSSLAWVYNSRGQVTAQCAIDPTVSGASSYTCGSATNAPTGVRQWTMTYCNAVDTTQCPLIGLLLTSTGPRTDLTQTTSYSYYLTDSATAKHGDLKTVTDALGHVTTVASYDGAGRITRTIDPNSSVTDYTYTPRGWLASRTVRFNPDGSADTFDDATTKITYTAYGAVQTVTDADGVQTTYGYDAAHRLTTITDALGNTIQYTLDASGNRKQEQTFASGSTTPSRTLTRTYNTLGQLTKVIDGLNQTIFDASAGSSYDGNGNLLQSSDANGIVHQQSYDALNRLVQRIDNLNGTDAATKNTTTIQHWDALDRLTQVTDPSSLVTTYGYDGLSNPISQSSPDTGTSHASFDAAGNMLSRTDAKGITVSHSYDALDRRLSDSYADSTLNASYHYDDPESVVSCSAVSSPANPIGHLTRIVESTVTTTWCYDRNDHLALQTQLTAGHTDPTEFIISGAGRVQGRIAPDNVGAFYQYDSAGRATTVTISPRSGIDNGSTPIQNATYLPFGPMTSYQLNYQTITRNYDANYALTDITSAALNLHFALDPMGNIIAEGNTAGASPAVESYSYDPLNQLKAITQGSTAIESLTYNPTGDRLSKAGGALATGTYGYDAGTHHLSSIGSAARTYDANGNTIGASSAGQTWGYGYNGRNRLTVVQAGGATVGTYTYNALGQRIQKTTTVPTITTQRFFYDEQSHLIGEYTEGGNNRDTIWLGDMPVATVDTSGATTAVNYVIGDGLGTPRTVVNDAGTTIWSWPYVGNAFGELAPTSATGYVLNLRLPGQYYDAESGLSDNVMRTYESATGRFPQPDPSGFNGGLGLYVYSQNNSLNNSDRWGLAADLILFKPGTTEYKLAQEFTSIPGTFTVAGHGTPLAILDQRSGKSIELSPARLAAIINASKNYSPGEYVLLLACNTGRKPNGRWGNRLSFAQYLAQEMNTHTQAPDNWGWFLGYSDGSVEYMTADSIPRTSWNGSELPTKANFNDPTSGLVEYKSDGN